jgi:hypothetical protein
MTPETQDQPANVATPETKGGSAATIGSGWIACDDRLPDLDEIVWLYQDGIGMWVGGRADDADGWLWGNAYSSMWWNGKKWDAELETDDDYHPTHWMQLPSPPNGEVGDRIG